MKGEIKQICILVEDVHKAMENYWELLGIGPWDVDILHRKPAEIFM